MICGAFSPIRPPLLILPKHFHHLGTHHSNICDWAGGGASFSFKPPHQWRNTARQQWNRWTCVQEWRQAGKSKVSLFHLFLSGLPLEEANHIWVGLLTLINPTSKSLPRVPMVWIPYPIMMMNKNKNVSAIRTLHQHLWYSLIRIL